MRTTRMKAVCLSGKKYQKSLLYSSINNFEQVCLDVITTRCHQRAIQGLT